MNARGVESQIDQLLDRSVEAVYPDRQELKNKLLSGHKLTIYAGFDPTGPSLHIGHGSILLKLKEFAQLGHRVVVLIGDFTAMIGDPTGKDSARRALSAKEVKANYRNYKGQIKAVLGRTPFRVVFNSKWFGRLKFDQVLDLASGFTVSQMLERDMFDNRVKAGKPIHLHELFYPLMQGYDSVMLKADVEVGGNDQTFNMLTGRTMLKREGRDKAVIALKLLTDSEGKKMGKTEGNMVALADEPSDMYGKVMSWPDEIIAKSFEICTALDTTQIKDFMARGPKEAKMALAREIVATYKGDKAAKLAEQDFVTKFQKKEIPEDIPTVSVKAGDELVDILIQNKLVSSKSEFRRLVDGGGVTAGDQKIDQYDWPITSPVVVKVGKRKFLKIEV